MYRKIIYILINFVIFSSISCKKLATDIDPIWIGKWVCTECYCHDIFEVEENGNGSKYSNVAVSDCQGENESYCKVRIDDEYLHYGCIRKTSRKIIEFPTNVDTVIFGTRYTWRFQLEHTNSSFTGYKFKE